MTGWVVIPASRRRCCSEAHKDFKYFDGERIDYVRRTYVNKGKPLLLYCVHCGQIWREERYMDAAGDDDTRLVKTNVIIRRRDMK